MYEGRKKKRKDGKGTGRVLREEEEEGIREFNRISFQASNRRGTAVERRGASEGEGFLVF